MTVVQAPESVTGSSAAQETSTTNSPKTTDRPGYKLLDGSKAYYRFSDIMFEWHKELSPYHANAAKSLLNFEALVHPTHPLRQTLGDKQGVVFYVAVCRDHKPRAFITFKQIEYLVYWIDKMNLVDGKVPIPSSKSLLFEDDLADIIPVTYADPAMIKKALNRPNQVYTMRKQAVIDAEAAEARRAMAADEAEYDNKNGDEVDGDAVSKASNGHEKADIKEPAGNGDSAAGPEEEDGEDPFAELDIGQTICLAAYHRAQQLLIVASSPEDLPLPADLQTEKETTNDGKINFISVHFNSIGLDTVFEVGWAKAYWNAEGEEIRDQGHWIVSGYENMANELPPYFFDDSEVVPLTKICKRLTELIDKSTYMLIHSNLKEFDEYSLVDLPVVVDAHVIDTVPIVQALSSDWAGASLQDTAKQMLAGSGQSINGFGNSGNDAYWHLETFLTLVGPEFDLVKELLLEEPTSDNEDEVEYQKNSDAQVEFEKQFHGIGLDDVELNFDELDYDIGSGGPEDEDDFL